MPSNFAFALTRHFCNPIYLSALSSHHFPFFPLPSSPNPATLNILNPSKKKMIILLFTFFLLLLLPVTGHSLMIAVIDTPEFQRLRSLKQLGGSVFVYPGASHTRFEHSLGVAHLAHRMVRHIAAQQPDLNITPCDMLCIKLAGLCHDLGHGPFSHMFETFVNRVRRHEGKNEWEHEDASLALLDHLLEVNDIDLSLYGLTSPREDVAFVKHLIHGLRPGDAWPQDIGRGPEKRFLFDIVANKRNGIDVDKLDYFVRDSLAALGTEPVACDIKRLIRGCRVCSVDGVAQVCYQEKMALGIFDIFKLRAWLHKYVYQHHTVNLLEDMLCEVFTAANDHWLLEDSDTGARVRLSDCVDHPSIFARVGDWVLDSVASSGSPELAKARALIDRIRRRKLYQAVLVPTQLTGETARLSSDELRRQILAKADFTGSNGDNGNNLEALDADLMLNFSVINYGSRDASGTADNPVTKVSYFNPKINCNEAYALSDSKMPALFTPRAFEEKLLYVYSRSEASVESITEAYRNWRLEIKARHQKARRAAAAAAAAAAASVGTDSELLLNTSVQLTPMTNGNPASPRKFRVASRLPKTFTKTHSANSSKT